MNIVQITPGAGGMFCGNCLRDNALVAALRRQGHQVLMVPLYLPMTLDEEDQSAGTPIFFSGINVYLEQKSSLFRHAPDWLHRLLESPALLNWAAGRAARTRPEQVGELTISMLRGEEGNQARELEELIGWLNRKPHPDVICLSNALLVGLVRRLKQELRSPIVGMLQGEDYFLDSLPQTQRDQAWKTLAERAADVDLFIAPSRSFGELMGQRLKLPTDRVQVVFNGINLEGYEASRASVAGSPSQRTTDNGQRTIPVLGYFARMCREKGLDRLVEAFLLLKRRESTKHLKLRIGGGCGPADEPFVNALRERLKAHGVMHDVEFHPNPDRAAKQEFLRSLTVFCVPALYGEAFGLYVIEALASSVPVVQPRAASFPELIEATGGGVLFEPGDPQALADAVEHLLLDPEKLRALGEAGRKAVWQDFNADRMAENIARVFQQVASQPTVRPMAENTLEIVNPQS
ncbi:MAG TPA: glycosyltransferase family 4 protein [Haliangiales bacterium]|nr:glycosyltransferase family 4 protein [Haliangiales bacterium]